MTDRETLELRANRMDIVSRWADDLAHEIKNPLHAMVINLELVKRRAMLGEPEPIVERAEIVESELQRVHTLVESLLRLVRPWPDRPFTDVAEVFRQLMPVLIARTRVRRVDYLHRPGDGQIRMAPGNLGLIVLNLVDNALEAMGPGGQLETGVETGVDQVHIRVVDSGTGLPDTLRNGDALEPGVSTRPDHHGLGLAVVSRLARDAGGELTLEPRADADGTRATLRVPRAGSE